MHHGLLEASFCGIDTNPLMTFRLTYQPRFTKKRTAKTITYCGLNDIRQCHVLHLSGLFGQFDSVGMFFVSLVLGPFPAICLLSPLPSSHFLGPLGNHWCLDHIAKPTHKTAKIT
jgi:hypothetical protein